MKVNQFDTLMEALNSLQDRGYTESFVFDENGCHLSSTQKDIAPSSMTIVEHHRFEGETSADDMSVVYAVECDEGEKGVIVDSFGAFGNEFLANYLKEIKINEE